MGKKPVKLEAPLGETNVLLHCCCAPCSGGIILTLKESGIKPTVLFYNPNIHPQEEYALRKSTLLKFLTKEEIDFIDADYTPDDWFARTKGLEEEPQRGRRCDQCFLMRLEYAARLARDQGFKIFTSSFGISRWKDMDQVNRAGHAAANQYGVIYWDFNWRKNNGSLFASQVAKNEGFYIQRYCGCRYSLNHSR